MSGLIIRLIMGLFLRVLFLFSPHFSPEEQSGSVYWKKHVSGFQRSPKVIQWLHWLIKLIHFFLRSIPLPLNLRLLNKHAYKDKNKMVIAPEILHIDANLTKVLPEQSSSHGHIMRQWLQKTQGPEHLQLKHLHITHCPFVSVSQAFCRLTVTFKFFYWLKTKPKPEYLAHARD